MSAPRTLTRWTETRDMWKGTQGFTPVDEWPGPHIGPFGRVHNAYCAAMELAFWSRALRAVCEDTAVARRSLDAPVAEQLRGRLADLRAADNVAELPLETTLTLVDGAATVTVDLSQGYRMVLTSNHPTPPSDVEIDWRRVRRLQVMAIERSSGAD